MSLALVTGATSGLGLALCCLLAEKKIPFIATGRDIDRLASLPALKTLPLDLSKDREPLLHLIRKHAPDLVINNAGYTFYGPALQYSTPQQMDILEVNAAAAIEVSLEAARALRDQNKQGTILNVASTAGLLPIPCMSLYAAAKACLTSFSQSFDAEMKPHGIRILVSLPGPIDTEFAARASKGKWLRSPRSMTKERAANAIWQQIEKKRGVQIIGWRNKAEIFLTRFIPKSWINEILMKSLSERL